jgi:hypothetical protein
MFSYFYVILGLVFINTLLLLAKKWIYSIIEISIIQSLEKRTIDNIYFIYDLIHENYNVQNTKQVNHKCTVIARNRCILQIIVRNKLMSLVNDVLFKEDKNLFSFLLVQNKYSTEEIVYVFINSTKNVCCSTNTSECTILF